MKTDLKSLVEAMAEQVSSSDILAAEQLAKVSSSITKCRIDRRMNQKEFADFLGVTQGMVSKWESEDYNFTIETLAKICDKLDLTLDINIRPEEHKLSRMLKYSGANWNYNKRNNSVKNNGIKNNGVA